MRKWLIAVLLTPLLFGCGIGGISVYKDSERNNHYRNFARITDAEDTDTVHFTVRKRQREVMAEREVYRWSDDLSLNGSCGRERQRRWNGALTMRYNF
jgi:hypothetical protein